MTSLLLLAAALADELPVQSTVEAVTVFDGRARVTRTATARVPEGRTDLVFEDLPLVLVGESLSASGEGAAALLGVDLRADRGTEDRDERVAALRRERQEYQDEVLVHRDTVARVDADVAFLAALQAKAPDRLDHDLFLANDAPTQLAALSESVATRTRALLTEKRTAERRIRDLEQETARVDREIARIGSETRDANRVAVGIDASRAGTVTVHLSYLVDQATWSPRYDARYDIDSDRVRLDLSGQVSQSTGEDWQGARLTLSTASPTRGTSPPSLSPWTLSFGGGPSYAPTATGAVASAWEFEARRAADIPSDGSAHQVPLASVTLEAETVHRTVARREPVAYLTAKVTNTAEFAWLGGPVNSYLGTAFVGRGTLPTTGPGGEASLSFGVDDRVAVERVRTDDTSFGTRALSNRERQTYGFETRVTNRTGQPITLVVVEQVPTSREARFEVQTKTTPDVAIPAEGVFEWEATVATGEEQRFLLEYEVSWPEGERPMLLD